MIHCQKKVCNECACLSGQKWIYTSFSVEKTLTEINRTIQFQQAWGKLKYSSRMNTWGTFYVPIASKKNETRHKLQVALCLVGGAVKYASYTCVAGYVGFCNHVLALMMKLCKFSLYSCQDIKELDNESDMPHLRNAHEVYNYGTGL